MKTLGPDDFDIGRLVTILAGPFHTPKIQGGGVASFLGGGQEMPAIEDTRYHGKVLRILAYDPPYLILEPLAGVIVTPEIRRMGPFTAIMPTSEWVPDVLEISAKTITVGSVSPEYAKVVQERCVPPEKRTAAVVGPVRRMLADEAKKPCSRCGESHK